MTEHVNGHTFERRDDFNRKPIADNIIKLLRSDIAASPIVIHGDWGSGKSEFCEKLINLIHSQNPEQDIPLRTVYVDAYKADHIDNPLLTLITAVLSLVPDKELQSIKAKVIPILRFGIKTGSKALVSWVLQQDVTDVIDDFEGEMKDAADAVIDKAIDEMIKEHSKAAENMTALKEGLQLLATEGPVVIFVDELDRCRPDFAVTMLETIKHVFNENQIKVVLITNLDQLEASIEHRYGAVDPKKYLQKFIGFRFHLSTEFKQINDHRTHSSSERHFYTLLLNSNLLNKSFLPQEAFIDLINGFIKRYKLSLRDVERLLMNFEIYQVMTDMKLNNPLIYGHAMQIVLGICLFSCDLNLASSITNNTINIERLQFSLGDYEKVTLNDRPSFEFLIYKVIRIHMRNSESRDFSKLDSAEQKIMGHFNEFFRGHVPRNDSDRIQTLSATLKIMGLNG